jgi:hypothetical protein
MLPLPLAHQGGNVAAGPDRIDERPTSRPFASWSKWNQLKAVADLVVSLLAADAVATYAAFHSDEARLTVDQPRVQRGVDKAKIAYESSSSPSRAAPAYTRACSAASLTSQERSVAPEVMILTRRRSAGRFARCFLAARTAWLRTFRP